jgi:hypothetical protein
MMKMKTNQQKIQQKLNVEEWNWKKIQAKPSVRALKKARLECLAELAYQTCDLSYGPQWVNWDFFYLIIWWKNKSQLKNNQILKKKIKEKNSTKIQQKLNAEKKKSSQESEF